MYAIKRRTNGKEKNKAGTISFRYTYIHTYLLCMVKPFEGRCSKNTWRWSQNSKTTRCRLNQPLRRASTCESLFREKRARVVGTVSKVSLAPGDLCYAVTLRFHSPCPRLSLSLVTRKRRELSLAAAVTVRFCARLARALGTKFR